jgi:hypothetical protein
MKTSPKRYHVRYLLVTKGTTNPLLSREVPVIEISHMRKTGMTYLASIALGGKSLSLRHCAWNRCALTIASLARKKQYVRAALFRRVRAFPYLLRAVCDRSNAVSSNDSNLQAATGCKTKLGSGWPGYTR